MNDDGSDRPSNTSETEAATTDRGTERTRSDGGTGGVGTTAERRRGPYVESTIIMTTVRVVSPFVFVLGLFVMFHGAGSPGGGFQGGAIVSAVVLMLAIAFGIGPTREWLDGRIIKGLIAVGLLVFAFIGLGSLVLGRPFLEYSIYGTYGIPHPSKYGIEIVELAIGAIVSGVLTGLFFLIGAGFDPNTGTPEEEQSR